MEKHHLLLSFFFHMRGTKKYMPMRDNNFDTTCQKEDSLQCLHLAVQTVQKHEDKNNTRESVKEREIRERERERYTQEGKATNFVAKVCCLQNFWSRVYFLTTQIHKKL